jgi:hypothetical protein
MTPLSLENHFRTKYHLIEREGSGVSCKKDHKSLQEITLVPNNT